MDVETAREVAKAMERAGFTAAAENFVVERARYYKDWQVKLITRAWLS